MTKSGKQILLEMILSSGYKTCEIIKALEWVNNHSDKKYQKKNENMIKELPQKK